MFDGLTSTQIQEILDKANEAYESALHAEQYEEGQRKLRIGLAVGKLTDLVGPAEGEPSIDSIRGILRYSDEEITQNAALAFRQILAGMEILALTVVDIANDI